MTSAPDAHLSKVHSVLEFSELSDGVALLHLPNATPTSFLSRTLDRGRKSFHGFHGGRFLKLLHLFLDFVSELLPDSAVVGLVKTVDSSRQRALGTQNASHLAAQIL